MGCSFPEAGPPPQAYNLRFGVRSIQHEVERKVVSKLAQAHERDHIQQGTQVKLAVSPNDPTDIVMYKVCSMVWVLRPVQAPFLTFSWLHLHLRDHSSLPCARPNSQLCVPHC